jgi:hypothetical protein
MPRKKHRREKSRMLGIYLENFQSIRRPTFINCQGLTFLYGPNSAGKSAVIDVLRLLRLVTDPNNRWLMYKKLEKEKPESKSEAVNTVIGLDYLQGKLYSDDLGASESWVKRQSSSFDEDAHVQFHAALKDKRVSVRFPDFNDIAILIDGLELFNIGYHGEGINEFHLANYDIDDLNTGNGQLPVNLWVVPARVAGNWNWELTVGGIRRNYAAILDQYYQNLFKSL